MIASMDDQLSLSCGQLRPISLVVTLGNAVRQSRYLISKPYAIIGRHAGCDVRLPHQHISKQHVYLQVLDGRLFCIDQGSRKGIHWKDKPRLFGWLDVGEWIQVGPYRITLIEPVGSPESSTSSLRSTAPFAIKYHTNPKVRARLALQQGLPLPLLGQMTIIGRTRYCNLELDEEDISRVHASIVKTKDGNYWLVDLMSRIGVKVNGKRHHSVCLNHNDVIKIGTHSMPFQILAKDDIPLSLSNNPSATSHTHGDLDQTIVTPIDSVTVPEDEIIDSSDVTILSEIVPDNTHLASAEPCSLIDIDEDCAEELDINLVEEVVAAPEEQQSHQSLSALNELPEGLLESTDSPAKLSDGNASLPESLSQEGSIPEITLAEAHQSQAAEHSETASLVEAYVPSSLEQLPESVLEVTDACPVSVGQHESVPVEQKSQTDDNLPVELEGSELDPVVLALSELEQPALTNSLEQTDIEAQLLTEAFSISNHENLFQPAVSADENVQECMPQDSMTVEIVAPIENQPAENTHTASVETHRAGQHLVLPSEAEPRQAIVVRQPYSIALAKPSTKLANELVIKRSTLSKTRTGIINPPHVKLTRQPAELQLPFPSELDANQFGLMDSLMQYMKQMQQEMMSQMRKNMEMMAEFMKNMQQQQASMIREELAQLGKLNKELLELRQSLLTTSPAVANQTPPPTPVPPTPKRQESKPAREKSLELTDKKVRLKKNDVSPLKATSNEAASPQQSHAWISKRIALLEQERLTRWEKMKTAVMGK